MEAETEWRFGVAGNIVKTHFDEEGVLRYGTKAFTGGTKVYIHGKFYSEDIAEIGVIGRNRFGRIVLEYIPINLIENFRAQRIYKPTVLEIIDYLEVIEGDSWWGRTAEDRKDAQRFVKRMKE